MVEFSLRPIIMLFVVVILGVVFLRELGDSQVENTELSGVTNESITMTATINSVVNETMAITSGTGIPANPSIVDITFFGNGNVSSHVDGITIGTQINFTKAGLAVDSINFTGNDYNISYTYATDLTGDTAQDGLTGINFFGNATNSTHLSSITIGTHVNFTKPGVITVDTHFFDSGSTYNISYPYEGDLYVVDTKSHVFLRLIIIFFVFVIFAFAIKTMQDSSDDFNFGFVRK